MIAKVGLAVIIFISSAKNPLQPASLALWFLFGSYSLPSAFHVCRYLHLLAVSDYVFGLLSLSALVVLSLCPSLCLVVFVLLFLSDPADVSIIIFAPLILYFIATSAWRSNMSQDAMLFSKSRTDPTVKVSLGQKHSLLLLDSFSLLSSSLDLSATL